MVSFTKKQKKQFRQARRAALGISKATVTAGKLASASGATGVGKKLQAGGRGNLQSMLLQVLSFRFYR